MMGLRRCDESNKTLVASPGDSSQGEEEKSSSSSESSGEERDQIKEQDEESEEEDPFLKRQSTFEQAEIIR